VSTRPFAVPALAGSPDWLRLARRARLLSWLTLGWLGLEAGVGVAAAVIAGSAALLGFGLDSGIEALASIIVIWRFTGSRLAGQLSERRAQKLVAVSFWLLAPYIAAEGIQGLVSVSRPETSWIGIVLTAGTFLLEPPLGMAKRRLGQRLGSAATAGDGTQNLLCAYLAGAVLIGLLANTAFGWWWLDGMVALLIAGWALKEGGTTWQGAACSCSCADPRTLATQQADPARSVRLSPGMPRAGAAPVRAFRLRLHGLASRSRTR